MSAAPNRRHQSARRLSPGALASRCSWSSCWRRKNCGAMPSRRRHGRSSIATWKENCGAPPSRRRRPSATRSSPGASASLFSSSSRWRRCKIKREGAKRKAADLSAWLRTILHLYGDRVLAFDSPTAEIAGALSDLARGRGHSPGFADVAIAATARRHDLVILSRNERDHVYVCGVIDRQRHCRQIAAARPGDGKTAKPLAWRRNLVAGVGFDPTTFRL